MSDITVSSSVDALLRSASASQIKSSINLTDVNVKDYGAFGNGTSNDYQAIKNAITAAGSSGTVFFPVGDYFCADAANGGHDTPQFRGAKLHFEAGSTLSVHNISFNRSTEWEVVTPFDLEIRSRSVTVRQDVNVRSAAATEALLAGAINSDKYYYKPSVEDFTTWTNATWGNIATATPTNTASAATVSSDTVTIGVNALSSTQAQVGYRSLTSVGEYLEMTLSNDTNSASGAVGLLVRCGSSERYYLSTSRAAGRWSWSKYDNGWDPSNTVTNALENGSFSHGSTNLPRIGVWVNKSNEFWFCINGKRVGRFSCTNSITDIGYITTVQYDGTETNYYNPYSAIRQDVPLGRRLKIGFVGDSITYGAGVTYRYPEMIKSILEANSGISNVDVSLNVGAPGDTIAQQTSEIQTQNVDFSGCDFVCCLVGTNDSNTSLSNVKTNIAALIDEIKSRGSTPIMGIPMPTWPQSEATYHNYSNGASDKYKEIPRFGPAISRVAAEKGVAVVDTFAAIGPQVDAQHLLFDGVHPNELGHAATAKVFASGILKSLEDEEYIN